MEFNLERMHRQVEVYLVKHANIDGYE